MTLPEMILSPVFQNSNIIKNIFVPHVSKEKSKKASHLPKHVPNSKKRALCYPKNDREDIGKLGAKGYIDFSLATLLIPVLTEFTTKDKENHGDNECDI
ncbi:hypothetical protein Tco_1446253 [Tanacetum coccineum]